MTAASRCSATPASTASTASAATTSSTAAPPTTSSTAAPATTASRARPARDYLDGGSGQDIFEGDNVCEAEPCTGDSDFIQARDGEADTVNCGVGADTAIVDSLDVVAVDAQHGCERIDRRTAAAVVTPPPARRRPRRHRKRKCGPTLSIVGVRKLSSLRRGKLKIRVACPDSCRVKARLITGRTVVASQTRTQLGAGVVSAEAEDEPEGAQAPQATHQGRDDARRRRGRRAGPHDHARPGPALPPLRPFHPRVRAAASARARCFAPCPPRWLRRADARPVAALAAQEHDARRGAGRRADGEARRGSRARCARGRPAARAKRSRE